MLRTVTLIAGATALGICAFATEVSAAPANDNFAARVNLGNFSTANTTGNNIGATLESGEPTFGGLSGASVWYEWTAPSSSWVSVDTSGSSLDTVVGVFTGTSVSTLTQIGYNDETFDPVELGSGHSSRLTFFATSGVVYKIAVHGWSGGSTADQGSFQLSIAQVPTPNFNISAATISPDPVNVTSAAASITVTVSASTTVTSGFVIQGSLVAAADTTRQIPITLDGSNRISGTSANGTYQATVSVPRYVPAGNWNFQAVSFDGSREVTWSIGTDNDEDDFVIPATIDATLAVTNTGAVDATAPVLESFTASATDINSGSSDQSARSVTLDLRVTDALSGFNKAVVTLVGSSDRYALATITTANRISGTAQDGIYEAAVVIPYGFPADSYAIEVVVTDASLLSDTFSSEPGASNPLPLGAPAQIVVTGSAGYPAWAYGQFFLTGQNAMLADADKDGASNLLEYAFNLSPSVPDAQPVITSTGVSGTPLITNVGSAGNNQLRVEYVRRKASTNSGLTYEVQFSTTLLETGAGGWTTSGVTPTVTSIDDTWERVVLVDGATGNQRRFARVKITYVQP